MKIIDKLKPFKFLDIDAFEEIETDYLVVGTGIAGLTTSLEIGSRNENVLMITKSELIETNTRYAQGGIAAVLSEDDKYELHIEDTLYAGAGLCEIEPVRILVTEGPERIKELLNINTNFDRKENGNLSLTKEAAHSKNRILHAGDTTGAEIERALTEEVKKINKIEIKEHLFLIDLIDEESCMTYDLIKNKYIRIFYKGIIFATGSVGQLYKNTSNPDVATGDGIAIAYRNGIELSDLEFVQFHPTTFYKEDVPRFLISEALRGEGGILRNIKGEAFMVNYHEKKELAPRDIVSRSILSEMQKTGADFVYLDMTNLEKDYLFKRFPNISAFCMEYDIDISKDYIPVSPAAHYIMGGIKTDVNARTSKSKVYAAGEAARTGVHGANRLASNSLLEGLVFGRRAALSALEDSKDYKFKKININLEKCDKENISLKQLTEMKIKLKNTMWENTGVYRTEKGLLKAMEEITDLIKKIDGYKFSEENISESVEILNMLTTAYLIAEAALNRRESRGAHHRLDFE